MAVGCSGVDNFFKGASLKNPKRLFNAGLDAKSTRAIDFMRATRSGGGLNELLGHRERTDRDVIPVRISERELRSSCVRVHVGLLFEPRDESLCWQGHIEIVHTKKQEEAVARLPVIG